MKKKLLTKQLAQKFVSCSSSLPRLAAFNELEDGAAVLLAKAKASVLRYCELDLSGLRHLEEKDAKALSATKGSINLSAVTWLSDSAAEALGAHNGSLSLDGLTSLNVRVANALAKHKGWLYLSGLAKISSAVARALAQHQGDLHLDGLTKLSTEEAEALGRHRGVLHLRGLATLTDAAAAGLGNHQGSIHLNSLTSLSDTAAECLSKHQGLVQLWALKSISDRGLRALHLGPADCAWSASLTRRAKRLSQPEAEGPTAAPSAWRQNRLQLGKPSQRLQWVSQTHMQKHKDVPASFFSWFMTLLPPAHINESHCITSEAADILLRHRGFFEQLRKERNAARSKLSRDHDDLAKIRKLITSKDEGAFLLALRLLHSTNASEEMWVAALPKSRIKLVSGQLHDQSYAGWQRSEAEFALFEAAAAKPVFRAHLFSSYGRTMRLALLDLSLPVAQTLALFRGELDLDDLGSVTDAAAEALSVHQGDLSLDGLTTLSPTAAKSLAEHKGSLSFYGLKSLSAEVAEALAVHEGYIGLGDEASAALECARKRLERL
jgi:hypothetical protein